MFLESVLIRKAHRAHATLGASGSSGLLRRSLGLLVVVARHWRVLGEAVRLQRGRGGVRAVRVGARREVVVEGDACLVGRAGAVCALQPDGVGAALSLGAAGQR